LQAAVLTTGFVDLETSGRCDVFEGAPQLSTAALAFGTHGITYQATKPN
jgi:hypothetical protein